MQITNERRGAAGSGSTFWNITSDGVVIASLQRAGKSWPTWYVTVHGDAIGSIVLRESFSSKSKALSYAENLCR